MVDIRTRACAHHGCTKQRIFGVAGSKAAEFCSEHKKAGMVNVVSKKCTQHGCANTRTLASPTAQQPSSALSTRRKAWRMPSARSPSSKVAPSGRCTVLPALGRRSLRSTQTGWDDSGRLHQELLPPGLHHAATIWCCRQQEAGGLLRAQEGRDGECQEQELHSSRLHQDAITSCCW